MTKVTAKLVYGMVVMLGLAQLLCGHIIYNVGGYYNWNPNVDYKSWAAGQTFHPGDVLEFKYGEGLNVKEVRAKEFIDCNGDHAIREDHSGRSSFPLHSAGQYYFICSVFGYCDMGMKLNVTVT